MSYEFEGFAQQGWQCPICRRVYSPTTPMCYYCGGNGVVTITTSTNIETPKTEEDFTELRAGGEVEWLTEKRL